MASLQVIYASTSGHTEYVIEVLRAFLVENGVEVQLIKAEAAESNDLTCGKSVLLASGTWNTGGIEGQMNPHMHEFLLKRAKDVDLKGVNITFVSLGDDRYFYTARAGAHMRKFAVDHGAHVMLDPLTIINEPYGQEEKITKWGEKFVQAFSSAS